MPMWFWYAIAAHLALLAIGTGCLMVADARRQRRITKARARENAATLAWIATQDDLDAAKGEARDVIDAATLPLSKSPAATRIRNQIADNEVARFRRELDEYGRGA